MWGKVEVRGENMQERKRGMTKGGIQETKREVNILEIRR